MNETLITVKNLKTFFYTNNRCNKAVNDVSFSIKKGKTLCLIGESGCGKSVTAFSIMQLLPNLARIESGEIIYHSDRGDIRIDQFEKNGKEIRALRGADIAMIFQDPMTALNPVYSIGFQIMENLQYHTSMTRDERHNKAISLLADMGIPLPERRIHEYPHQFSGGMCQRAIIAMAMACNPKVLIADEPTTSLDVTTQAQVFSLMTKLKNKYNTAIMLITHDMGVVTELADDVIVMYMGNFVEGGTAEDVLRTPMHPYTKALLRSILTLGRGRNQIISSIRGATPDPYDRPQGCQFAPRCDYCTDICNSQIPPPEHYVSATHRVQCWNYREVFGSDGR